MKPKRFRVNAMASKEEMEVLENLGGQTKGIAELVRHFLSTHSIYLKKKAIKEKAFSAILKNKKGK
jgi:hypothetical protein